MDSGAPPSQNGGMGKCYVFKSRLQEYVQRAGFNTPEYHTIKEGLSHDPIFRSTVVVNNVKYESLPGFSNRKAAEQSAAEVALLEILKSSQTAESIPAIHETGLCKNMLQEYAQKMNFAMPSYVYTEREVGAAPFICTVEIGGIRYIGAASKFKKEAELKAARTALIAIQRKIVGQENAKNGTSPYTVLPTRKKSPEPEKVSAETKKLKPRKNNMKKKWKSRKRLNLKKQGHQENVTGEEPTGCNGTEALQTDDVSMSEARDISKEEFRKPSFDENQVGANCVFNAGLDETRAVSGAESCCGGSNVMEST